LKKNARHKWRGYFVRLGVLMDKEVTLLSREPWWVKPPIEGQDEMACEWVFVEFYSDGSYRVIPVRPTDEEIKNRKACRLK
jgi:hypothetical protein